ncbi:hypothetical protein ANCCAN_20583 [Ancylostoma caninum]|uniref:Uncharacterized protein n=1 Tax=Ancylostoma caninum TaxID=29170 RepID=A0A368FN68_ANCCA|nr:hypothetical protein ANCCAN_20583 [Ancylostoma caninum]
MDVSDPSLQVDTNTLNIEQVSLSLPSSPSASNRSAPSPLPTTDDFEYGEDLNTAFDDGDLDSIISPEGHMISNAPGTLHVTSYLYGPSSVDPYFSKDIYLLAIF